jgi:hypothetical protein|eukprot:COSAG01_NODE_887_length_12898_cov_4.702395_14_plen_80_part_00
MKPRCMAALVVAVGEAAPLEADEGYMFEKPAEWPCPEIGPWPGVKNTGTPKVVAASQYGLMASLSSQRLVVWLYLCHRR